MISNAPASSARAFPPVAGSISGTAAEHTLETPMARIAIPVNFIKVVFILWC